MAASAVTGLNYEITIQYQEPIIKNENILYETRNLGVEAEELPTVKLIKVETETQETKNQRFLEEVEKQKALQEKEKEREKAREAAFYAKVGDGNQRLDQPSGLSDEVILAKYKNYPYHPLVRKYAEGCLAYSKKYHMNEFIVGAIMTVEASADESATNLTGQSYPDGSQGLQYDSVEQCFDATFENWRKNYFQGGYRTLDRFVGHHNEFPKVQRKIKDYYMALATVPVNN